MGDRFTLFFFIFPHGVYVKFERKSSKLHSFSYVAVFVHTNTAKNILWKYYVYDIFHMYTKRSRKQHFFNKKKENKIAKVYVMVFTTEQVRNKKKERRMVFEFNERPDQVEKPPLYYYSICIWIFLYTLIHTNGVELIVPIEWKQTKKNSSNKTCKSKGYFGLSTQFK